MSFPNVDIYDDSIFNNDDDAEGVPKFEYFSVEEPFFSMYSKENQFKNSLDISDMQSLSNLNNKNIEGDKECSPAPAPAPLRSPQSQNENQKDLGNSHNMECPEVVNKYLENNNSNLDEKEMLKIFNNYDEYTINDDDELIEKPFDKERYFIENDNLTKSLNNIENSIFDLENKSAAVNVVPINDNLNSPPNKINSVSFSNSSSNIQELSCPNNFKTPLCSKNNDTILFINTCNHKNTRNKKGIIRKLKPDSLRKKIKARFHKKLRQIINIKLKECGSKYLFDLLPQPFVTNINIEFNKPLLNITMRELFQKTFGFKAKDREKINYNIRVMKYIEDNPNINNNEKISNFLDSTYEEIIQKYMHGKYLLEDIERLKKEGENSDYINRYSFIAIHWIDFYKNGHI